MSGWLKSGLIYKRSASIWPRSASFPLIHSWLYPVVRAFLMTAGSKKRRRIKSPKDPLSRAERSERMSRVRSKHTQPELRIRRLVFSLGYRYRLHSSDLPCTPDLVFRKTRKIILVHGCFWHCHRCKYGSVIPATRAEFWAAFSPAPSRFRS